MAQASMCPASEVLVVAHFITTVNLPAALPGIWFVMQFFREVGFLGPVAQGGEVAFLRT